MLELRPIVSHVYGRDDFFHPALFFQARHRSRGRRRAGHARLPTPGKQGHSTSTPQTLHATLSTRRFRPAFGAQSSRYLRAQSPAPLPQPADGVAILEPLWERPAGTQTHLRRTGWRLGRLCCARQEVVRVPKSNTKYGGKRGITGGNATPVIDQVSVSPRGFGSQKLSPDCPSTLCTAVRRARFSSTLRLAPEGLTFSPAGSRCGERRGSAAR